VGVLDLEKFVSRKAQQLLQLKAETLKCLQICFCDIVLINISIDCKANGNCFISLGLIADDRSNGGHKWVKFLPVSCFYLRVEKVDELLQLTE